MLKSRTEHSNEQTWRNKKCGSNSMLRRKNNSKQTNKYTKSKESHRFLVWKSVSRNVNSAKWKRHRQENWTIKTEVEIFEIVQFIIGLCCASWIAVRDIKWFDVQFTWERLQWQWTPSLISFSIKITESDVNGERYDGRAELASPETWNSAHRTRSTTIRDETVFFFISNFHRFSALFFPYFVLRL